MADDNIVHKILNRFLPLKRRRESGLAKKFVNIFLAFKKSCSNDVGVCSHFHTVQGNQRINVIYLFFLFMSTLPIPAALRR